jgi:hypothetical protein
MRIATLLPALGIVFGAAYAPACGNVVNETVQAPNDSGGGSGPDSGVGDGSGVCVPMSCVQLGAECGTAPNSCGGILDCGPCTNGLVCGGAGPNKCGKLPCTPRSCVQQGASCGVTSDGCSQAIDCGSCSSGKICLASNQCGIGVAGSGGAAGTAGVGGAPIDARATCYDNLSCGPDQWCDLEPAPKGSCRAVDSPGTCTPRPAAQSCPDHDSCPGVCGCDGLWYCDACAAHVEGISITQDSNWCLDGGSGVVCGGEAGIVCAPGAFCKYPPQSACGYGDSTGICSPAPTTCSPGGPPVCGCDGQPYSSECEANSLGIDITGDLACKYGNDIFSAQAYSGGLLHVYINRLDSARIVCLTLHIAAPASSPPNFTAPAPWGLVGGWVSLDPDDCGRTTPGVYATVADSATGWVHFSLPDGGTIPCTLDVSAALHYSAPPAGFDPTEWIISNSVAVSGCR